MMGSAGGAAVAASLVDDGSEAGTGKVGASALFGSIASSVQRSLDDADDLTAHVFHRRRVNIDAVNASGGLRYACLCLQPQREVIRGELQPQARLDKMMMNGVHADVQQSIRKLGKVVGDKCSRQHDDIRGAEIKRLMHVTLVDVWSLLNVSFHDLDDLLAHRLNRSELTHIHTG